MTALPNSGLPGSALRRPPLPDPPRTGDFARYIHFIRPGPGTVLAQHFGAFQPGTDVLVSGRGYICAGRSDDLPSCPYPDLVVAFGVDVEAVDETNGYVIEELGKPPEFVLEAASSTTGRRDYVQKREIYARLGITEYWRFDHTGGRYHDAPLGGDRLAGDGAYRPVELFTEPDGVIWGYSETLGLSLCWINRRLRFWNRATQEYLPTPQELAAQSIELAAQSIELAAERDNERLARYAVESQRDDERQARYAAEERVRELEAELRRLRGE